MAENEQIRTQSEASQSIHGESDSMTEKDNARDLAPQERFDDSCATAAAASVRGHAKLGKTILLSVCAVILAAFIGISLFVNGKLNKLNYNEQTEALSPDELQSLNDSELDESLQNLEQRDSGSAPAVGDVFSDKNVINILVCGTDMRIPNTKDQGRCDAAVIVSLNKTSGDVKLISFERSIGIPTPSGRDTKLNNAFNCGGGDYMQEVISNCFLVDLAGYVHLSYETIPQVFDAIGGIDVELNQSEIYYISRYVAYDPDKPHLQVGMNNLRGWAAYGYCRLRDGDDNYARQHRVRNALQAAVEKMKTMSFSELNTMADEVLPLIGTNLTKAQIRSLILSAPKFANATVEQMSVPQKGDGWHYQNEVGEAMLGVDYAEYSRRIQDFLYGN